MEISESTHTSTINKTFRETRTNICIIKDVCGDKKFQKVQINTNHYSSRTNQVFQSSQPQESIKHTTKVRGLK